MRTAEYVRRINEGTIVPAAQPTIERDDGSILSVGGQRGFGQLGGRLAATLVAERAEREGLAVVTLADVHHVGRVGEYIEPAAERGLVALGFCSAGSPGGLVAPHLGRGRVLGTNPVAFAVPTSAGPMVGDFSTSA